MLSELLKRLRKEKGLTQVQLAEKIGISNNLYNKYEKQDIRPPYETISKLAEVFGVSVDYLLGRSVTSTLPSNVSNIYPLEAPIRLPLYGDIAAGQPINTDQSPTDEWVFEDPVYGDGNHFVLKVSGNSMEPEIPNGSLAIIRHQDYAEKGQIVAVVIDGECATLKRYIPQDNGTILFQANNPNAQSYVVTKEQCNLGEVRIIGILRETKRRYY